MEKRTWYCSGYTYDHFAALFSRNSHYFRFLIQEQRKHVSPCQRFFIRVELTCSPSWRQRLFVSWAKTLIIYFWWLKCELSSWEFKPFTRLKGSRWSGLTFKFRNICFLWQPNDSAPSLNGINFSSKKVGLRSFASTWNSKRNSLPQAT